MDAGAEAVEEVPVEEDGAPVVVLLPEAVVVAETVPEVLEPPAVCERLCVGV